MASDNRARLEDALIRAHEAGDTEAAQIIAAEIKGARSAAPPATQEAPNVIQRFNRWMTDIMPAPVNEAAEVAGQPASGVTEGVMRLLLSPIEVGKSVVNLPEVLQNNLSNLLQKIAPGSSPEQAQAADKAARMLVMSNPAMLSLVVGGKLRRKMGLPEPAGYEDFKREMMKAGITAPAPTTAAGRVSRRVGEEVGASVVPLAATMRAAGQAPNLMKSGQGVIQQAIRAARENPASFAAQDLKMAAFGGLGAGIAKEIAPESSAAEFIGLMTGTFAPTALEGTVRRIVRGGEGTRKVMEKTIKEFADAGVTPTVGMATRRRFNEAFESGLAILPGSSGRMAIYSEKTARKLYDQVDNITAGIAPIRSPDAAGRAIQKGIAGYVQRFKTKWRGLDAQVATHVKPTAAIAVPETRAAMQEMMDPATTAAFPQLTTLAQRLDKISTTGAMSYKDLRMFRSSVGGLIPDSYAANLPEGALKKLYAAMSKDLRGHLAATSPAALKSFDRSNRYYTAAMARLDERLRPLTASDIPERVYAALERSGNAGPTVINAAKRSIGQENWDVVAGTIMNRMGMARAGEQGVDANAFSINTFMTNWSKYGRNQGTLDALMSGTSGGSRFVRDMNAVARVTDRFREAGRVFANPSGTARAIANIGLGTSVASTLLSGQWGLTAKILAIAGGANMTARAFTNPKFVHFLAQTTRVPASRVPNLAARLASQMASEPEFVQAEIAAVMDRISDEFSLQSAQEQEAKRARANR